MCVVVIYWFNPSSRGICLIRGWALRTIDPPWDRSSGLGDGDESMSRTGVTVLCSRYSPFTVHHFLNHTSLLQPLQLYFDGFLQCKRHCPWTNETMVWLCLNSQLCLDVSHWAQLIMKNCCLFLDYLFLGKWLLAHLCNSQLCQSNSVDCNQSQLRSVPMKQLVCT